MKSLISYSVISTYTRICVWLIVKCLGVNPVCTVMSVDRGSLGSWYSTVFTPLWHTLVGSCRSLSSHCHLIFWVKVGRYVSRVCVCVCVCARVCVRLTWLRATSPSARVHESPQSRCCSSPGAQKHPQTLTRCTALHRGDKTTWVTASQPGGYVIFYFYIFILLSYTSQAASADSGWSRWVTCELQNLSDVLTVRAFVPETLELLCVNSPPLCFPWSKSGSGAGVKFIKLSWFCSKVMASISRFDQD